SGVLATLGTGPPLQEILPTTVSRLTPLIALARACLSSTLPDALRAAAATSNRAWTKPMGWVHCLPVWVWYSPAPPGGGGARGGGGRWCGVGGVACAAT